MQAVIKKWGNHAAVRIPRNVLKAARLKVDMLVDIREEDGKIIIEPVKISRCLPSRLSDIEQHHFRTEPAS